MVPAVAAVDIAVDVLRRPTLVGELICIPIELLRGAGKKVQSHKYNDTCPHFLTLCVACLADSPVDAPGSIVLNPRYGQYHEHVKATCLLARSAAFARYLR
jgi:hypothetical protein